MMLQGSRLASSYSFKEHTGQPNMLDWIEQRTIESGLLDYDGDYDTIVGSGLSGACVIPAIARVVQKSWVIIRKPNDGSHNSYKVGEGRLGRAWVFVDDFIATGSTLRRVTQAIEKTGALTQRVGVWQYADSQEPDFDFNEPRYWL